MRLRDLWTTAIRRWYLVLVAVLCSAGATVFLVNQVGPTYEAEGAVLVFPPTATVERNAQVVTEGNPYLVLEGVTLARDVVIRALTSKSTRDDIATQIPSAEFEATPDFMNSAPIILITVAANSAAEATSALANVMDRVPVILNDLQAGLNLDDNAVITSQPLITDTQPQAVHSDQIRAGIVVAVAALGASMLLIGLIDGLLLARRRPAVGREPSQAAVSRAEQHESENTHVPSADQDHAPPRRLGPRVPVSPTVRARSTDDTGRQVVTTNGASRSASGAQQPGITGVALR